MIVGYTGRTCTSSAYANTVRVGVSILRNYSRIPYLIGQLVLSCSDSTYASFDEVKEITGDDYAFLHELPPAVSPLRRVSTDLAFSCDQFVQLKKSLSTGARQDSSRSSHPVKCHHECSSSKA